MEDFHPDSRGSAYIDQFLTHAFRFNLRTNLLGSCTIYHEKLCYRDRSISTKAAIDIAHLLGSLVDRGKAGIVFTEDNWIEYLTSNGLPLRLNPPAYKAPGHHKPTSHIIDRLLFEVVRTTSNRALANLHDKFKDVGTYDDDLVYLGKSETEAVAEDPEAANVIKEAKKGIKAIHEYWRRNNGHTDEDFGRRFGNKKKGSMSFNALVQRCCDDFLALPPVLPPHVPDAGSSTGRPPSTSPTIAYWERQHRLPGGGSWSLLKASLLFAQHHRSDGFCWYVAGRELGELKATARGRAGYRTVVKPVHEVLRVDNKAIERVKKRGDMMAKEGGGLDDNTGEWIGEDGVEDEGMESQYGDWAWTEEILI